MTVPTVVWPIVFAIRGRYDSVADWFGKLSDFVVHPAAVAVHFPRLPGDHRVSPYEHQPAHEAGRLVALAFESRDPALLGIALHAVQDSYAHRNRLPASHLGSYHRLDSLQTATSRSRAADALRRSYLVLAGYTGRESTTDENSGWERVRGVIRPWLRSIGEAEPDYEALRDAYSAGGAERYAEPAGPAGFAEAREAIRREVASW